MPENDLFTCIYREGKLPNNGTNTGIHRCEKPTENVGFSVWKTRVNVSKMPRFSVNSTFVFRTVNASFFFFAVYRTINVVADSF